MFFYFCHFFHFSFIIIIFQFLVLDAGLCHPQPKAGKRPTPRPAPQCWAVTAPPRPTPPCTAAPAGPQPSGQLVTVSDRYPHGLFERKFTPPRWGGCYGQGTPR